MKKPSKKILLFAAATFALPLTGCRDIIFFYPKINADEYLQKIDNEIGKRALKDMNSVGLNYDALEFPKREIEYGYRFKKGDRETLTFYNVKAIQGDNSYAVNFSYEVQGYGLVLEEMGRSGYISDDCIYYLGDIEQLGKILANEHSTLDSVVDANTDETYFNQSTYGDYSFSLE